MEHDNKCETMMLPPDAPHQCKCLARGLLLWALYHHQGGSSEIGQPIRRALGIGQHDHLTARQISQAKAAAKQMTPNVK